MTTDNPIAKHLKEYHRGELRVVPRSADPTCDG